MAHAQLGQRSWGSMYLTCLGCESQKSKHIYQRETVLLCSACCRLSMLLLQRKVPANGQEASLFLSKVDWLPPASTNSSSASPSSHRGSTQNDSFDCNLYFPVHYGNAFTKTTLWVSTYRDFQPIYFQNPKVLRKVCFVLPVTHKAFDKRTSNKMMCFFYPGQTEQAPAILARVTTISQGRTMGSASPCVLTGGHLQDYKLEAGDCFHCCKFFWHFAKAKDLVSEGGHMELCWCSSPGLTACTQRQKKWTPIAYLPRCHEASYAPWMCEKLTPLTQDDKVTKLTYPGICFVCFSNCFQLRTKVSWGVKRHSPNWEEYACCSSMIKKPSLNSNEQGNCCQIYKRTQFLCFVSLLANHKIG